MYYVKDTKDPNWLVVVKTKPQDWYGMPMESTNEVCQENEDISLILLISNVSHEHDFPLHRNDLVQSTTNENPMIPMKVISDDDEESDDKSIDLSMLVEKRI